MNVPTLAACHVPAVVQPVYLISLSSELHCPAVEALQQQLQQISLVVEQSAARGAVLQRQLAIAQQEGQDMGVTAAAAAADAAFLQAQLGEASSVSYGCEMCLCVNLSLA